MTKKFSTDIYAVRHETDGEILVIARCADELTNNLIRGIQLDVRANDGGAVVGRRFSIFASHYDTVSDGIDAATKWVVEQALDLVLFANDRTEAEVN